MPPVARPHAGYRLTAAGEEEANHIADLMEGVETSLIALLTSKTSSSVER